MYLLASKRAKGITKLCSSAVISDCDTQCTNLRQQNYKCSWRILKKKNFSTK